MMLFIRLNGDAVFIIDQDPKRGSQPVQIKEPVLFSGFGFLVSLLYLFIIFPPNQSHSNIKVSFRLYSRIKCDFTLVFYFGIF